jgi:ribosomal protein L25 (general stress protein Ctc)
MPVEMVTRRLRDDGNKGTIVYGYKFRPVVVGRASVEAKDASVRL